jgi:hypothetical protein
VTWYAGERSKVQIWGGILRLKDVGFLPCGGLFANQDSVTESMGQFKPRRTGMILHQLACGSDMLNNLTDRTDFGRSYWQVDKDSEDNEDLVAGSCFRKECI